MKIALIIIFIGLIIGSIFLLVLFVRNKLVFNDMLRHFKKCNVIVDGKKGTGKDIIFDTIIHKRKKEYYYANIDYGYKYKHIDLKDISVSPNTYNDFIVNKVTKINRTLCEKSDIYISDGGIFLPSYMDATLYKKFPSFPIYYALSRHLYNSNVHVNVQNFDRLWKAIREQADFFVHVRKTIKLPFILITCYTTYDNYNSARQYLQPVKNRLLNNYSKANNDIYNASNGTIRNGFIIRLKKHIHYDTRAFEKVLLKGKRLTKPLNARKMQKLLEHN